MFTHTRLCVDHSARWGNERINLELYMAGRSGAAAIEAEAHALLSRFDARAVASKLGDDEATAVVARALQRLHDEKPSSTFERREAECRLLYVPPSKVPSDGGTTATDVTDAFAAATGMDVPFVIEVISTRADAADGKHKVVALSVCLE